MRAIYAKLCLSSLLMPAVDTVRGCHYRQHSCWRCRASADIHLEFVLHEMGQSTGRAKSVDPRRGLQRGFVMTFPGPGPNLTYELAISAAAGYRDAAVERNGLF